eukprot:TRINITY_DN8725_c0_g1_i1.p1 TRINITY_DN8725_c0_g1~~TRINITY_DN8725_c0_g1_i1.p1  ORF type:complete len:64 (+),score=9.72 TRINITY_DN8725_c0_g1_i1:43-234(+)
MLYGSDQTIHIFHQSDSEIQETLRRVRSGRYHDHAFLGSFRGGSRKPINSIDCIFCSKLQFSV